MDIQQAKKNMTPLFFLLSRLRQTYLQSRSSTDNGSWTSCPLVCPAQRVPRLFLKYSSVRNFPEWLPGMEFKRKAREWAKKTAAFCDKPYAFVQHQMVQFSEESLLCIHSVHASGFRLQVKPRAPLLQGALALEFLKTWVKPL